ncbi:MAG: hypothetical protein JSU00_04980 [Acidobacteria bacterium]|nr:hypothetical protein [Acidobacteriota bacterium]
MAESIRKVDLFSIEIAHKTGEGAKALGVFRDAGVGLVAVWGYPTKGKKGRIDLVAADKAALTKAAKKAGIVLGPKQTAFLLEGDDQTGALAGLLGKLAEGGINVIAAQAVCGGEGKFGGVITVGAEDVKKAAKLLGAK